MTGFEHAHYLQCLVERALEDGCSHVVTLHVDSFPLQRGWAQTLAEKLNSEQPLAVISPGQYTACLLFVASFTNSIDRLCALQKNRRLPCCIRPLAGNSS